MIDFIFTIFGWFKINVAPAICPAGLLYEVDMVRNVYTFRPHFMIRGRCTFE